MLQNAMQILQRVQEIKSQRLSTLDMSGLMIDDSIDDSELIQTFTELLDWHWLEALNLSNNLLTSIPKFVFHLESLKTLDLSENVIITLPEGLAELKTLSSLNLGSNGLTTLPGWLAELKKLSSLDLGGNDLTTLPTMFA